MKKGSIYCLIAGLVSLSACSGKFQTYDLSNDYATSLHYQPAPADDDKPQVEEQEGSDLVGVPALSFYGGDLKRGGIWWGSKGVYLEKGDEFIFEVTQIGPDSTPDGAMNPAIDLPGDPFGATFSPIDLIKVPSFLKISARAEGDSIPILYLQVDDANGNKANAKRPAHQILNSPDYLDYYFDLRGIYEQLSPKQKVNGAMVNRLTFFINAGKPMGYTGKIYMKEIKVVPASSVEVK